MGRGGSQDVPGTRRQCVDSRVLNLTLAAAGSVNPNSEVPRRGAGWPPRLLWGADRPSHAEPDSPPPRAAVSPRDVGQTPFPLEQSRPRFLLPATKNLG